MPPSPRPRQARDLWVHLGGSGTQLVTLAPANGFPPQVYLPLVKHLTRLQPELQIWGWIPKPMRTLFPPPENLQWEDLAREYVQALAARHAEGWIGMGHSLGGVMSLMAWVMRPKCFRTVILLDPVIFEPRVLWAIRRWQRAGADPYANFPLARLKAHALNRRRLFPSPQEALAHFQTRRFFQFWHPDALKAYVRHGLRPTGEGTWTLAYDPRWEAAIFGATPTDVWRWVRRAPGPGIVLFGEHSEMGTPTTRELLERFWKGCRVVVMEGRGHMFPAEAPEATARVLADILTDVMQWG